LLTQQKTEVHASAMVPAMFDRSVLRRSGEGSWRI
jgi:hypothetical protein